MPDEQKANKSEAIRQYLKSNRKAKSSDVAAALKEQGIDVTPQTVSTVKFHMKRKRAAKRNGQMAQQPDEQSNTPSKAHLIRDAFKTLGLDAAPKDVIATLAGQGVTVSSSQVIGVRHKLLEQRAARRQKLKRRRPGRAAATTSPVAISVNDLVAAKKLAEKLGSLDALKSAVTALEQLGG